MFDVSFELWSRIFLGSGTWPKINIRPRLPKFKNLKMLYIWHYLLIFTNFSDALIKVAISVGSGADAGIGSTS
jgi:hypothetical protein